jgi:N-[(2S)-2-amino-2-carboxyethyl]-L-glutamate dehydrogenase
LRDRARGHRGAGVVIAATTTTTGYIPYDWLAPGTVLLNVSLDDVLPDVVELADLLFVDDGSLVRADDRRLLGGLYRAGRLQGPDESEEAASDEARRVTATLGDVIIGRHPGRARDDEVVLVNPFGMALLDLQLAGRVCERAEALNVGKIAGGMTCP